MDLIEWEILKNPGASERFQPAKDFLQQLMGEPPFVAAMQELSLVPDAVDPASFVASALQPQPVVPEDSEDGHEDSEDGHGGFRTTGVT